MSYAIVADIILYSQAPSTAKYVLIILAHHAHDDGTNAYCSLRRIQKLTGLALSTVEEAVALLERDGHALVAHRQGPNGTNRYTILRPWKQATVPVPSTPTDGIPTDGIPSVGTPASGTEQNRTENPFSYREPVHRNPVHVLRAVTLTEKELALVQSWGLKNPDYVEALTRQPVHVPETNVPPTGTPAYPTAQPLGTYLGTSCKRNPAHQLPSGKSWRINVGGAGRCWACAQEVN